jgi:hypothetical protein
MSIMNRISKSRRYADALDEAAPVVAEAIKTIDDIYPVSNSRGRNAIEVMVSEYTRDW